MITIEVLKSIRDTLLKECKKEIPEFVMPYADGILDFYNEVKKGIDVEE